MLAANPDGLRLMPRTNTEWREKWFLQVVIWFPHVSRGTCDCPQTHNKLVNLGMIMGRAHKASTPSLSSFFHSVIRLRRTSLVYSSKEPKQTSSISRENFLNFFIIMLKTSCNISFSSIPLIYLGFQFLPSLLYISQYKSLWECVSLAL